ncbi:MAG TPA: tetratricopeptide repeat protein [Candidatus Acidoferrales bacterium]|nr:tetratricopeptide repeat protein [Candidatus Acidoferrales bacterium]
MITRTFLLVVLAFIPALTASADSAQELLAAGRVDEAVAELNGHLASAPSDAESSNLLCRAYYELEDWEHAEFSCKKAASLDPDNSRFHLWLGRVYGEKADRANALAAGILAEKARGEFEHAVQLNPNDVDARLDLAEFYVLAPRILGGGEQKAREQAQSIGTLNPGREHWVYARIAEQKKDAVTAEREYRQYIDLSKGTAEAWLNLAYFLRRQLRIEEMEQALVKLSQAPMPRLDALFDASEILYRTGRSFPFATELLRRYLAAGPVEAAPAFKARYLLGQLLEKQGDKAGAAQEYRASLSLARNFAMAQQALNRVAP